MLRFIQDTRKVTDDSGLPAFPAGFIYNFYEQYLSVSELCYQVSVFYASLGSLYSTASGCADARCA